MQNLNVEFCDSFKYRCSFFSFTISRDMLIFIDHYMQSVQIRSFLWSVYSYIQSEYRKIRNRKISPVFGHFSRSGHVFQVLISQACWRAILFSLSLIIIHLRLISTAAILESISIVLTLVFESPFYSAIPDTVSDEFHIKSY